MPSAPSSSLNLDISCLRHLVSRHHSLSQLVLPSAAALPKYERALTRLHGPGDHTRLIAMQALHTAMSAVYSSLFRSGPHDEKDLFTIIRMVHYIIGLDLHESIFNPTVQSPLLIAYIHAVIRWFPSVPREQWRGRYRSILDLLRSPVWTSHLNHVKNFGITEFKAAVSSAHKLPEEQVRSRSSPERFAAKFALHYPLRKLRVTFQRHLNSIQNQLPTLRLSHDRRKPMQRNEDVIDLEGIPDFFSDAECINAKDEGGIKGRFSPMQSDEDGSPGAENGNESAYNNLHSAPTRRKVSVRRRRSGRSSKGSAARCSEENPKLKSLRKRKELNDRKRRDEEEEKYSETEDEIVAAAEEEEEEEEKEEEDDDYHEENDKDTDSDEGDASEVETPPEETGDEGDGNNEGVHHVGPADLREMDQVGSDAFYGSDDPSETTHVARRQRSKRASAKRQSATGQKYNPVNRHVSEGVNGVQREDESSVAEELEENEDEDDAELVGGTHGESLRQLKDAAAALSGGARLPDPLPKSLQEARRARKNVRRLSSWMYSPAPDARAASPIPDSETPVTRKRTRRFNLDSDSDDFTRNGRRIRRRQSPPRFYGKRIRTGRFQAFEDDQLKSGLKKYGWGAWTEISKNLGTGDSTRAPMSLKDRARTLELDPRLFPEPVHKRGRPRVLNERKQRDTSEEDIEEDLGESSAGDRQA